MEIIIKIIREIIMVIEIKGTRTNTVVTIDTQHLY